MDSQRIVQALMQRLFIELEASGRHVHLTREAAFALFGHGLTEKRPLSQPGQFACEERVRIEGPKRALDGVSILGPERSATQVELSMSDARSIGIAAPIRESGDVAGSACTLAHTTGQPLCRLDGSKLRRFGTTPLPQK